MNNLEKQNNDKIGSTGPNEKHLQNTETAAVAYADAGLSVLPLDQSSKKPVLSHWKFLQYEIAKQDQIQSWFTKSDPAIGIICGSASGNVELLDFDEKYNLDPVSLLDRFRSLVDSEAHGLIGRLVIETSQNGGMHLVYRCSEVEQSRKLASRAATEDEKDNGEPGSKTLVETRGEGGYFMCAPSKGYTLMQGSLLNIPSISPEERKILLECACSFDEVFENVEIIDRPKTLRVGVKRPGDDFNLRGDIFDVLAKHNWRKVAGTGGEQQWVRPGKSAGISATFNYGQRGLFYVFSSNAAPFQPMKAYSKFAVFAFLEHNGDWSAAAAELAKMGYGSTIISEAEDYLSGRYEFRNNVITGRTEYRSIGGKKYVEIRDLELNSLYRELQRYHIRIGIDTLSSLLHSNFVKRYDPFREYFESLPAWDLTTDHIEQLANTVTLKKADQKGPFKTSLEKWLVNAVACAVEEVVTNHNALILVGPQGHYKTTWINRLVPSTLDRYKFIGTINPENKDTLIHLAECFLINLDELETLGKHELGTLKSIMTLQHIRLRRPYGRVFENLVRRASFAGSINRTEFLKDETGSRRFLTFEIDSIDINHNVNLDLVYSQAYTQWKTGFRYWFDQAEIRSVNERNKEFVVQTTEDELIAKYFMKPILDANTGELKSQVLNKDIEWLTATDVAVRMVQVAKYSLSPNSAKNFGVALTKAGYQSKKSESKTYAVVSLCPEPDNLFFGGAGVGHSSMPSASDKQEGAAAWEGGAGGKLGG